MVRSNTTISLVNVAAAALLGVSVPACGDAASPLAPELTEISDRSPGQGLLQAGPAASRAPLVVRFEKEFDDAGSTATLLRWEGTVGGAVNGTLVSTIDLTEPGTREAGRTLHAWVTWIVDAGGASFEARTFGVINFTNGIVRTNGQVAGGWNADAGVHQQGTLTGLDATGFLRIRPATAGPK